jgi:hypothetical protein
MTEVEWFACPDSFPLLNFLVSKVSDRKLRLFGAACCTRWRGPLPAAVEVALRYADGLADEEERKAALAALRSEPAEPASRDRVWQEALMHLLAKRASDAAHHAAACVLSSVEGHARYEGSCMGYATRAERESTAETARLAEIRRQATLLRDILGNPFRPIAVHPDWHTADIITLAGAAYGVHLPTAGHLDSDCLPILADALEDAGCSEAAILDHLRSPGPHVRGCWAVDVLLARE